MQLHSTSFNFDDRFKKRDFNSIHENFQVEHLLPKDLLKFYKNYSRKKLFKQPEFWNSSLPLLHLKEILESDIKMSFYKEYFSKNEFSNPALDKQFIDYSDKEFIKYFKLFKAFRHEAFMNSLNDLASNRYITLKIIAKEFHVIAKLTSYNSDQFERLRYNLSELPLDELLLGIALWSQKVKTDIRYMNDRNELVKVLNFAVEELSPILSKYSEKGNPVITYVSNSDLQAAFNTAKTPDRFIPEKDTHMQPTTIQRKVMRSMDELLELTMIKNTLDMYCCGFADIKEIYPEEDVRFITNEKYDLFSLNDRKKGPEEIYMLKGLNHVQFNTSKGIEPFLSKDLATFQFYGLNTILDLNDRKIDLLKVLELLETFSRYKGPEERTLGTHDGKEYKVIKVSNRASNDFIDLFGPNESITVFDHAKLLVNLERFFKWTPKETNDILNFLTLDLSEKTNVKSWLFKPFIKNVDQIIWIGTLLKDRRWDNILLNRIKQTEELKNNARLGNGLENRLKQLFDETSFSTIFNKTFELSDGQKGEVDLIAFKDDSIILFEAKTSVRSDDYTEAVLTQSIELEGKAALQLQKCETYLSENWNTLKKELCIDENLLYSSIRIIPLIITDNFEGDHYWYKSKYRKISLLELEVIMKNNKRELLENYLIHEPIQNNLSREIDYLETVKIWDLWNGEKEFSVNILINAIDNDLVWEGYRSFWNFQKTEMRVPLT
jgi:hypothetical protein